MLTGQQQSCLVTSPATLNTVMHCTWQPLLQVLDYSTAFGGNACMLASLTCDVHVDNMNYASKQELQTYVHSSVC